MTLPAKGVLSDVNILRDPFRAAISDLRDQIAFIGTAWEPTLQYIHPCSTRGSDGVLYDSLQSSLGQDPTTPASAYWADHKNIPADTSVYETIAQLRLSGTSPAKEYATVLGYYTPGDGGGGPVRTWKIGAGQVDNGGTIIVPGGIIGDVSTVGAWVIYSSARVEVKAFGAKGDGITDDTVCIQAAIDNLQNLHFGKVDIGYRVTSPLTVSDTIRISGDGVSPYIPGGPFNQKNSGSWIFLDHLGVGLQAGTGTQISGVEIFGIGTYRAQNAPGLGWSPIAHDFDIDINNADTLLRDILNLNATKGIRVTRSGRVTLDNVRGQYFEVGIALVYCTDVVRVDKRHSWPFWSTSSNVTDYQKANLIDIALNRVDAPIFSNCFSIYNNIGLGMWDIGDGVVARGMFTNVYFDGSNEAIFIDSSVNNATATFVNCFGYGQTPPVATAKNVKINGSFCNLGFTAFGGANLSNGLFEVNGASNRIDMDNVVGFFWDSASTGATLFRSNASSNEINITGKINTKGSGSGSGLFSGVGNFSTPSEVSSGIATIASGTTSVVVTHNYPITPRLQDITVTPTTGNGASTSFWISSATASTFNINCDVNPTTNISFAWKCKRD